MSMLCCHDNGNVVCAKFHDHTNTGSSSPEVGCYWLQLCYFAMTVVTLDYMCVQSFVITHMQCSMLIEKYKVIYVVIA